MTTDVEYPESRPGWTHEMISGPPPEGPLPEIGVIVIPDDAVTEPPAETPPTAGEHQQGEPV